jgi:hypothetical protein
LAILLLLILTICCLTIFILLLPPPLALLLLLLLLLFLPSMWHGLVLWPLCMCCLAVLLQQLCQLLLFNCMPQPAADAAAEALLHLQRQQMQQQQ